MFSNHLGCTPPIVGKGVFSVSYLQADINIRFFKNDPIRFLKVSEVVSVSKTT